MTEEKKPTPEPKPIVVMTRAETNAEYAERRHREVTEREAAQAALTKEAFGQSREAFTGGTVLEGADSTEDAISILITGKKHPKKEEK